MREGEGGREGESDSVREREGERDSVRERKGDRER